MSFNLSLTSSLERSDIAQGSVVNVCVYFVSPGNGGEFDLSTVFICLNMFSI